MADARINLPSDLDDLPEFLRRRGFDELRRGGRWCQCTRGKASCSFYLPWRRTDWTLMRVGASDESQQLARDVLIALKEAGASGTLVDAQARCDTCDYVLTGCTDVCPECGEPIRLAPLLPPPRFGPRLCLVASLAGLIASCLFVYFGRGNPGVARPAFMMSLILGPGTLGLVLVDVLWRRERTPFHLLALLVAIAATTAAAYVIRLIAVG